MQQLTLRARLLVSTNSFCTVFCRESSIVGLFLTNISKYTNNRYGKQDSGLPTGKVQMNSTTLLHEIRKLKVGYFGHIKRHESLEKHILEAKAAGRRGRGRPMRRWEQDIQDWLETTTQAGRMHGGRSCGVLQENPRSNVLQGIS